MSVVDNSPRWLPRAVLRNGSVVALCVSALWSCDPTVSPSSEVTTESAQALSIAPLGRVLRSIDVSPLSQTLRVELNQKGQRTFKVIARYNDRSTANVTADTTFTIDNAALGTFTGNRFDSVAHAAAHVDFARVTARYREGGIEVTATTDLTVAWLRNGGTSPDILITLPYKGSAVSTTLAANSKVQALDTFLAVDTTGSMGGPINSIIRGMTTDVVPAIQAATGSSFLGVGAVDDFPYGAYGSPGCGTGGDDQPFILLSVMTGDMAAAQTAVGKLLNGSSPRGCGSDLPEGQMEALYQIATGAGNVVSGVVDIPPHHDKGKGGVEFRAGALPVVAMITDAAFHTVGEPTRACSGSATDYSGAVATVAHSRSVTTAALNNVCARVLGISISFSSSMECLPTQDLTQLATDTGALIQPQAWDATGRPMGCAAGQCCTGVAGAGEAPNANGMCPLVFKTDSSGAAAGKQLAAGITQLVGFAPYDVSLAKSGVTTTLDGTALPAGKTTADFLGTVVAVAGTPPATPSGLNKPVASGDHFTGTVPGSALSFRFEAKNDFLVSGSKPKAVKAKLQALASGCAVVDDRDVLIIIPPA